MKCGQILFDTSTKQTYIVVEKTGFAGNETIRTLFNMYSGKEFPVHYFYKNSKLKPQYYKLNRNQARRHMNKLFME